MWISVSLPQSNSKLSRDMGRHIYKPTIIIWEVYTVLYPLYTSLGNENLYVYIYVYIYDLYKKDIT